MKKKTVITTDKFEVWVIPQSPDVPDGVAQAPEADIWEPESSNESSTPLLEEQPNNVLPTHED